ncbi:MAG: hypothetical protein AB1Z65_18110 [Candidatus Sulfomarinibacteraceae bacterium]
MKTRNLIVIFGVCIALVLTGSTLWGAKGGVPGKPDGDPEDPPPTPIEGYYFWRLGHMDGPHTSSKALGISRDGKVAVGSTVVVSFDRAWRMDIDWAIATDDGIPPLYNELQVQEDIGVIAPPEPSAAFAASDMICESYTYDKVNLVLDWCGSMPVGTYDVGQVSYGIEWMLPLLDRVGEDFVLGTDFWSIPDFGGGISDMTVYDVSADGLILVGTGHTMTGPVAFRADTSVLDDDGVPVANQLTITDEFYTLQTLQNSSAQAVSADGTIIAGFGGTATGNKAFVTDTTDTDWTADEPILVSYVLPALDGGKWSEAYALTVTDEGDIYIAGRSDSPKGPQACIWFQGDDPDTPDVEAWLVRGIGGLSKKKYDSVATSILYRPGSTAGDLMVVGYSKSILYPSEAFVWTGNPVLEPDGPYTLPDGDTNEYIGYMYDLEKILIKTGAGEASLMGSSWILNQATGVALNGDEDGARIVGWGINPEGGVEAWLVTNYPYDDLEFTHE